MENAVSLLPGTQTRATLSLQITNSMFPGGPARRLIKLGPLVKAVPVSSRAAFLPRFIPATYIELIDRGRTGKKNLLS